jgi:hypothetical protein
MDIGCSVEKDVLVIFKCGREHAIVGALRIGWERIFFG